MTSVCYVEPEMEFQSLLFDVADDEEFATIPDIVGRPLWTVWPNPPVYTHAPQLRSRTSGTCSRWEKRLWRRPRSWRRSNPS
jgi:hypothetical protein